MTDFRITRAQAPRLRLLLAHGAGTAMDHGFMELAAAELAAHHIEVWRFEFPYMQKIRADGRKRPPDRLPTLIEHFAEQVARVPLDLPLWVGGKSMGGRVATHLCCEGQAPAVQGGLVLGYPFFATAKATGPARIEHFPQLNRPVYIAQGERDRLGGRVRVEGLDLGPQVHLWWVPDASHDLEALQSSNVTLAETLTQAAARFADFAT